MFADGRDLDPVELSVELLVVLAFVFDFSL